MSPSSNPFITPLFVFGFLPAQGYLFWLSRCWIGARIDGAKTRKWLFFASGSCLVILCLPIVWRAFFGLYAHPPGHGFFRGLFMVSTMWGFGSVACAAILLVYNLFRRINLTAGKASHSPADLKRRKFLRTGVGMAAAAPFLGTAYGVLVKREHFEIDHLDIRVTGLSAALSQLTVVQLSDIHLGPFMSAEDLAEYVQAANRLRPDLIALTGDFVTGSREEVKPCVETLAGLESRYGTFACVGNHDIYAGAVGELTEQLAAHGIKTLRNGAANIRIGNTGLSVLGIDDLKSGNPDLSAALASAGSRPDDLKILLSHRPEIFPRAAGRGIDLVLSGHYHGGQVKLGADGLSFSVARLLTPYSEGLFGLNPSARGAGKTARASNLFVSRGIGVSGLPIRINCPPQIAHLRLIKA